MELVGTMPTSVVESLSHSAVESVLDRVGGTQPLMGLLGLDLSLSALVFMQLEPYMDENFISRAFATMGETVMSVKIIRNRLTGYSSLFIFLVLDK